LLSLALPTAAIASYPPPSIFFEFDSAQIPENRAVDYALEVASGRWRDGNGPGISIEGHADRSGPASYNLELSRRRVEAVRDRLIERGVPLEAITIEWWGETRPLVETADGVREAQNRRVEFVIEGWWDGWENRR
jgi:outer membrane protein OmpA-like peptidoglycan-associated protein